MSSPSKRKFVMSRSVPAKKPHKVQLWSEGLMIGAYDVSTIGGRKAMDHDIELIKKVLTYEQYRVVMQRKVVTRV